MKFAVIGLPFAGLLLVGCVSTGTLQPAQPVAKDKLKEFNAACVAVSAEGPWKGEVENLKGVTIERLKDKKVFKTVMPCGSKGNPKVLRIALHIKNIEEGNAFLAGMGWGGHTEMNFDVEFKNKGKTVGKYFANANSQQKFTWAGNRFGNLTGKTLANAAAEVTVFIEKQKNGEEY